MSAKASSATNANLVQLSTRLPKKLHHAIKLHCVKTQRTIAQFAEDAIREKLGQRRKT